jgi:hypothetical protein
MRDWDPIGVFSGEPGWPEDEYDAYATVLCGGLFDPAMAEAQVAAYLAQVAEKGMGFAADTDAAERAARAIVALRKEFCL